MMPVGLLHRSQALARGPDLARSVIIFGPNTQS